jgi:hypothetical protein
VIFMYPNIEPKQPNTAQKNVGIKEVNIGKQSVNTAEGLACQCPQSSSAQKIVHLCGGVGRTTTSGKEITPHTQQYTNGLIRDMESPNNALTVRHMIDLTGRMLVTHTDALGTIG